MLQVKNVIVKEHFPRSGKRPHCVASCDITRNHTEYAHLVIDWYSPLGSTKEGFYAAFRLPGYTERQKPQLRIWLGKTLDNYNLENVLHYVAETWSDCFSPGAKQCYIQDVRLIKSQFSE
jgi:hypothetical protein